MSCWGIFSSSLPVRTPLPVSASSVFLTIDFLFLPNRYHVCHATTATAFKYVAWLASMAPWSEKL